MERVRSTDQSFEEDEEKRGADHVSTAIDAEQSGEALSVRKFQKGDVEKVDFEDDSFEVVVNAFMVHIVEDPVAMLNEIERITKPEGKILITDLRRIWLGLFIKKLKPAHTLEEGEAVIKQSNLRAGQCSRGPFWWDYMAGF